MTVECHRVPGGNNGDSPDGDEQTFYTTTTVTVTVLLSPLRADDQTHTQYLPTMVIIVVVGVR